MNVTCPSCGAEMDLDVVLAHEDSRRALARLAEISLPLGKLVLQYLRLFKPATRQMGHSRTVKLIEELLPDLQRQAITHRGRDWEATRETWRIAIERVLEQRDIGKLVLPLKSHGYLYEVIVGLVDKAEAAAERGAEAARRSQAHAVRLTEGDTRVPVPFVIVPPPEGPSRMAMQMKAQNEAYRKAREAGGTAEPPGGTS